MSDNKTTNPMNVVDCEQLAPLRLDTDEDVLFNVHPFDMRDAARLMIVPRGAQIDPVRHCLVAGPEVPAVFVALIVDANARLLVLPCQAVPFLEFGRYDGYVQACAGGSDWVTVGDKPLILEFGDVSAL